MMKSKLWSTIGLELQQKWAEIVKNEKFVRRLLRAGVNEPFFRAGVMQC